MSKKEHMIRWWGIVFRRKRTKQNIEEKSIIYSWHQKESADFIFDTETEAWRVAIKLADENKVYDFRPTEAVVEWKAPVVPHAYRY